MTGRVVIAWVATLLTATGVAAQQTVQNGPWTIGLGATGPDSIAYKGEVLLRHGQVVGYQPQWKGGRFALDQSQLATSPVGATWSKQVPADQDATLAVTTTTDKVTLTLDTTLRAAGPTEYSVELVPEAVRTNEKYCFGRVNGEMRTIDLVSQFNTLNGVRELRFERLDRTIVVRCEGAMLQDRRDRGSGLFLVFALNGEGETKQEKRSVEVEVLLAKPEEIEARRAILAQAATEQVDVPVPNGAFETGLDHWGSNPRAALDTEVKHGGKQSARVTIPAEQTDRTGIYLTQNVPVTGGLLYSAEAFVRAQDVKAATLGDMSPTGATVILEWADKSGKWMAAGDYAPGIYGTADWRRVSTKLMRSPKEAGFAVVFLALRATGTAWFDDVKLTQVQRNVVLMRPSFGATVADNTPEVAWQYSDPATARLELSPDPAFPADKTRSYADVQQSPFSPDQPLPPGRWYWRVSIPEHSTTSAVWQFEQTAPLTQDCTPPAIAPDHAYLAGPRQAVTVNYSDNVAVTQVTLKLDGREVSAKINPTRLEYAPPDDWQPGLHQLEVVARDAAGNQATRLVCLNYAPGVTRKEWLAEGGVAIGGRPQFLLGMYGVRPEDMPELASAGFDYVHNYAWDGAGSNESAVAYLDACQKLGLQAFIGFDRQRLQARDEGCVVERIAALCRHPALLAWYLFDEPDLPHQYVPPDQLRRFYQLIKTLDPMHPVIVTVAQRNMMPLYHDSYDVYWSMDYATPGANAANFESHRKELKPGAPILSIVHCYDGKQPGPGKGGDPEKFQPDPVQLRACAFMAIAHNTSGLCWWWWGQGSGAYLTVADAPKAWAALKETVRQIRELRPLLEVKAPIRTWVEKPAEGIEVHLWEKSLPDRTVIVAVNRDRKACDLTFTSARFAGKSTAPVRFENRAATLTAGRLSDRFEPLAVHVYELK